MSKEILDRIVARIKTAKALPAPYKRYLKSEKAQREYKRYGVFVDFDRKQITRTMDWDMWITSND